MQILIHAFELSVEWSFCGVVITGQLQSHDRQQFHGRDGSLSAWKNSIVSIDI